MWRDAAPACRSRIGRRGGPAGAGLAWGHGRVSGARQPVRAGSQDGRDAHGTPGAAVGGEDEVCKECLQIVYEAEDGIWTTAAGERVTREGVPASTQVIVFRLRLDGPQ